MSDAIKVVVLLLCVVVTVIRTKPTRYSDFLREVHREKRHSRCGSPGNISAVNGPDGQCMYSYGYEPEFEFEYTLDCPKFNNPHASNTMPYTVALGYHVGLVNNWKDIVADQLRTLDRCGLGRVASNLILSYSNGDASEVLSLIEPYNFAFNVTLVQSTRSPWEGEAANMMHRYCQDHMRDQPDRPAVVFYFHTKGASKWKRDWREHIGESRTYSMVLHWRKYMEYFTIERPGICIDHILRKNASTCGANMNRRRSHYSGTFWAASCDYLSSLVPVNMSNSGYFAAEFWIGQKFAWDKDKFVNLHYTKKDYYHHLILPEQYTDYAQRWQPDSYIANVD